MNVTAKSKMVIIAVVLVVIIAALAAFFALRPEKEPSSIETWPTLEEQNTDSGNARETATTTITPQDISSSEEGGGLNGIIDTNDIEMELEEINADF